MYIHCAKLVYISISLYIWKPLRRPMFKGFSIIFYFWYLYTIEEWKCLKRAKNYLKLDNSIWCKGKIVHKYIYTIKQCLWVLYVFILYRGMIYLYTSRCRIWGLRSKLYRDFGLYPQSKPLSPIKKLIRVGYPKRSNGLPMINGDGLGRSNVTLG